MATMASGSRMPRSSVNFSRGRILPRATPVRSGTRHSISVTRFSLSHCSRSAKVARFLLMLMDGFLGVRVDGAVGSDASIGPRHRMRGDGRRGGRPASRVRAAQSFLPLSAGLAEGGEHAHRDIVAGSLPLGMPLNAEVEPFRAF